MRYSVCDANITEGKYIKSQYMMGIHMCSHRHRHIAHISLNIIHNVL